MKLTQNLNLTHIEENNVLRNNLIAVGAHFTFYGEQGTAYLSINDLNSEWASFAMIEGCNDLHESFVEQLEQHWDEIVKVVKVFHEHWKANNDEYETCRLCGEPTEQCGDDELCEDCFSRNEL